MYAAYEQHLRDHGGVYISEAETSFTAATAAVPDLQHEYDGTRQALDSLMERYHISDHAFCYPETALAGLAVAHEWRRSTALPAGERDARQQHLTQCLEALAGFYSEGNLFGIPDIEQEVESHSPDNMSDVKALATLVDDELTTEFAELLRDATFLDETRYRAGVTRETEKPFTVTVLDLTNPEAAHQARVEELSLAGVIPRARAWMTGYGSERYVYLKATYVRRLKERISKQNGFVTDQATSVFRHEYVHTQHYYSCRGTPFPVGVCLDEINAELIADLQLKKYYKELWKIVDAYQEVTGRKLDNLLLEAATVADNRNLYVWSRIANQLGIAAMLSLSMLCDQSSVTESSFPLMWSTHQYIGGVDGFIGGLRARASELYRPRLITPGFEAVAARESELSAVRDRESEVLLHARAEANRYNPIFTDEEWKTHFTVRCRAEEERVRLLRGIVPPATIDS